MMGTIIIIFLLILLTCWLKKDEWFPRPPVHIISATPTPTTVSTPTSHRWKWVLGIPLAIAVIVGSYYTYTYFTEKEEKDKQALTMKVMAQSLPSPIWEWRVFKVSPEGLVVQNMKNGWEFTSADKIILTTPSGRKIKFHPGKKNEFSKRDSLALQSAGRYVFHGSGEVLIFNGWFD